MRIVIMGSGRTGALLATMLVDANHDVSIIDYDDRAFSRLPEDFSGETILGNALEQDVLRRAGIESADVFVAATSGDNRNVMASELALHAFNVGRVVARIKDPNRAKIYSEMGLQVDCRTMQGAQLLLDMVDGAASEQTS